MTSKQRKTARTPTTLVAAALLSLALMPLAAAGGDHDDPPATSQLLTDPVDTGALGVPGELAAASEVMGLATTQIMSTCDAFGIPDPLETAGFGRWFAEGPGDGTLTRAELNGGAISPQDILDFLQENKEQDWARIISEFLTKTCGGGFAFCVVFTPGVAGVGAKVIFCTVCCGVNNGRPYAHCDGDRYTAQCGCAA